MLMRWTRRLLSMVPFPVSQPWRAPVFRILQTKKFNIWRNTSMAHIYKLFPFGLFDVCSAGPRRVTGFFSVYALSAPFHSSPHRTSMFSNHFYFVNSYVCLNDTNQALVLSILNDSMVDDALDPYVCAIHNINDINELFFGKRYWHWMYISSNQTKWIILIYMFPLFSMVDFIGALSRLRLWFWMCLA